jgi:hypothetical protein
MGRDVIFYIGFSNLAEGSGDFVTSVEVLPLTEEETVTEAPTEVTELKTTASTATETTATTETVTTSAVETTTVQTTKSTETITEKSDVKGIVMFDENGNEIKEFSNKAATENTEDKKSNVGIAVGVTAGVIVVIGAVLMIFYKRKKGGK